MINKAFTLLELVVVIIIIGILATLSIPGYQGMRENALNNEAKVNLNLILAAENIYRMEIGEYFLSTKGDGGDTDTCNNNQINNVLRLSLPKCANSNFAYLTTSGNPQTQVSASATRLNAPADYGRVFNISKGAEPCCAVGGTKGCRGETPCP